MATNLVLTSAGLAEIVAADQSGTDKVTLSKVGFGTGQYTAKASRTSLVSPIKTLDTVSGGAIAQNVIHLEVTDSSSDSYTVYEVGVFSSTGTLVAVYSQTTPILQKASAAEVMLAIDIALTSSSATAIAFGDTTYYLPAATTEVKGLVELATTDESKAGTDAVRAVTPSGLSASLEVHSSIRSTGSAFGHVKLSDAVNSTSGATGAIAATPAAAKTAYDRGTAALTEAQKKLPLTGGTLSGATYAPTPDLTDSSTRLPTTAWVRSLMTQMLLTIYPVGAIYISTNATSPAAMFGGTWVQLQNRFLVAAGSTYPAGSQSGAASHTLSVDEMPSHTHSAWTDSQGGHAHDRGEMNITGSFMLDGTDGELLEYAGAFYPGEVKQQHGYGHKEGPVINVGFDASKSWTGVTSTNGAHGHNVGIGSTGEGKSFSTLPPYLAVYMWQRTA